MQRLSDIAIGKEYIIDAINDDELAQKLLEMGCTPGEKVVVERNIINHL